MQWKSLACIGFPQYEVSDIGGVRHSVTGEEKEFQYNIKGYYRVRLWSYYEARTVSYLVHRLVGLVWVPNPYLKPIVNHDDEDIHHNCRLNLRWMTQAENVKYSIDLKRKQLKNETPF